MTPEVTAADHEAALCIGLGWLCQCSTRQVCVYHTRIATALATVRADLESAEDACLEWDRLHRQQRERADALQARVTALETALRSVHACATYDQATGECGGCAVSSALAPGAGGTA